MEKVSKKRSDDEHSDRVKSSRESELREEISNIKERLSKSKKRESHSPTSSTERKEKRRDTEKKKKKDVIL